MSLEANDPRSQSRAKAAYAMPTPSLGPCLWRDSPTSNEPLAAIVTGIGQRSVNLAVIVPENRAIIPYDGVRHITDPELSDNPDRSNGCWDFSAERSDIAALQVGLGVLGAAIEDLRSENAALAKQLAEVRDAVMA